MMVSEFCNLLSGCGESRSVKLGHLNCIDSSLKSHFIGEINYYGDCSSFSLIAIGSMIISRGVGACLKLIAKVGLGLLACKSIWKSN
jgi:hypothetical protein